MRSTGTVLVVDDYEPNLSALRLMLQNVGYSVTTASNGREALERVSRDRPDLVLMDVVMPELSGVEVCAVVKGDADTCLTPVVLVSGTQERAARIDGLAAGADDFLSKPVDAEELYARVRSLIRLKRLTDDLESAESLFLTLGRIVEARDPCTQGHCERLAEFATALGISLGLDDSDLAALYRGAFLHDIGKIGVPDSVLLKRGKLTPSEYEVMKNHPVIGDELCATVRSLEPVRPIVRHHHERQDGAGYPDGLAGDEIPLLARIVSVVDVFDALTSDRPYRRALWTETAYEIMRGDAARGWCDAMLVEAFIDMHRSRESADILRHQRAAAG
jgi:putative two-component system response regulator